MKINLYDDINNINDISTINIETLFDSVANNYDEYVKKANYHIPDWIYNKLNSINFSSDCLRFLDLACGNGLLGRIMYDLFDKVEVHGVDISEEMIREAISSSKYTTATRWNLKNGIPEKIKGEFDVITSIGLFELIDNQEKILSEIHTYLKKDGHLICSFEAYDHSKDKIIKDEQPGIIRYTHTLLEVIKIVNSASYDIIEIVKQHAYTSPSTKRQVKNYLVYAVKI